MSDTVSTGSFAIARKIGLFTAILAVIANMVGAGVFTTTGFLVRDIGSSSAILIGWALGGVVALCGALSYGELVASISENGGEYRLLSNIFHPAAGVVAGLVSLIAGFCAPIAASALAFGSYLQAVLPEVSPTIAAIVLIIVVGGIHSFEVKVGGLFQNVFTIAKVGLIAVFIVGGVVAGDISIMGKSTVMPLSETLLSSPFAVGLIFIAFAYSGWNAAAYLAGEVRRPTKNLPLALIAGTLIVALLYLGLNVVFLSSAPAAELAGKVEVGHVAAVHLFGSQAGALISGLIALALVSSVSAMTMVGARVYEAMGKDFRILAIMKRKQSRGSPIGSIALQAGIAIIMVVTSSFESLLTYIGFTLSLSAALTVSGVFVLRRRQPGLTRRYKAWGYPITPLIFIVFSVWMITHALIEQPVQAIAGLITIIIGLLLYAIMRQFGYTGASLTKGDSK
jgi:APA family basic amino acid/polyamine antiporter